MKSSEFRVPSSECDPFDGGPPLRPGHIDQNTREYIYPILLVAGLAASAAGAGIQMAGAAKATAAMNSVNAAERTRQAGYQQEAEAQFNKSLAASGRDTTDPTLANAAAQRVGGYQDVATQTAGMPLPERPSTNSVVSPTASSPLARDQEQAARTGNAWQNLAQTAQGKMGAYEDWNLAENTKNQRASQQLALTSNFARSSASVLPTELQNAQHAGDKLDSWGKLLGALGSVAGTAGAMGIGTAALPIGGALPAIGDFEPTPVGGYDSAWGRLNFP